MRYERNVFHKAAEAIGDRFGHSRLGSFIHESLIKSQKFIVPDAGQMLAGKAFDDFKESLRLPFDRISLFREVHLDGARIPHICVAVSPHVVGADCQADFYVADCMGIPGHEGAWSLSRPIGIQLHRIGGGIQTFEIEGAKDEERALTGYAADHSEGFGALNAISELLLMLSLDNVSTRLIEAPQKLNAKRLGQGKLPLYDYHVLLVDGEETARSDGSDSLDRMVRAHFRRGHIRRLPDSRRVWVRAAYVHGRADGFVDKDYLVKLAAGS